MECVDGHRSYRLQINFEPPLGRFCVSLYPTPIEERGAIARIQDPYGTANFRNERVRRDEPVPRAVET